MFLHLCILFSLASTLRSTRNIEPILFYLLYLYYFVIDSCLSVPTAIDFHEPSVVDSFEKVSELSFPETAEDYIIADLLHPQSYKYKQAYFSQTDKTSIHLPS